MVTSQCVYACNAVFYRSPEVTEIAREIVALREDHWNDILEAVNHTIAEGVPIVRPLWWTDPDDFETYRIDDQYMLGDNILVAPVVKEGGIMRDIYLHIGTWMDKSNSTFQGPGWLQNFPAPLRVLLFFKRVIIDK